MILSLSEIDFKSLSPKTHKRRILNLNTFGTMRREFVNFTYCDIYTLSDVATLKCATPYTIGVKRNSNSKWLPDGVFLYWVLTKFTHYMCMVSHRATTQQTIDSPLTAHNAKIT